MNKKQKALAFARALLNIKYRNYTVLVVFCFEMKYTPKESAITISPKTQLSIGAPGSGSSVPSGGSGNAYIGSV